MACAAAFAAAVIALAHPLQGGFDAGQLAAFDLGQLRADLVLGRIERGIDHVAGILLPQLLEQAQVARQRLTQRVAAADENLPQAHHRIFTCHLAPPLVSSIRQDAASRLTVRGIERLGFSNLSVSRCLHRTMAESQCPPIGL